MSLVMRGWIEVIGCLIMLIQSSNVGGQSTTASCNGKTSGRTFYVAFMEVANMQQLNLQVFASRGSSAPDPIEVTIEISGFGSSTLTIASDDPLSFNIPSDKVLRGSSTSQNGVFINATADVSVLALVEEAQACSSITIHSATALGRRYVATTYAPNPGAPAGNFLAEIAVVATSANTEVQFKFPEGMQGNVMFDGTTYTGGQTLNVRLNRLGTAQVQSESDLTGTLITSSADTAVFSGNMKASLSEAVGAVMEQLVHISTAPAASVYVFQNFPGALAYMIKLVATQPNTEVSILAQAGTDQTTLASVGSSYSKQFGSNEIAIVESNRPLQAMQIGVTRPALMTVPSTISYLPEFRFAIPFDTNIVDYENTILIVANATDTNTFQLNGAAIPSSSLTWRSSGVAGRTFQVGTLNASAGYQVITNTNTGARFTVAVYGSSDDHNCAYAYPAGMCLDWIVPGEQSLSSSTSAQQIQTGRTTPPRGQSSTSSQSTSSGSTSLSQSTSSGSTSLSLSSSTVIDNIPGSSETSRERNPTPTVSGSSTESTTELSSSLPSGSSESTVRRGRTPTASSSTETPTISISSTPTFPVSSSTTAPISSTPTFSPSLSPSATFTVSSSGPVSTFGPSDGLSTTTVSSGTSELFSASGSTSLSSSTSTSGTSPARSPTQFSTVSTLSTQPSGISSPTRMPTDFTTLSSGESTILSSGESTRMPTDFSTLSNSEPNPSSSTREPTNFSTVSNGTVMSTSEGSAVSTTPTIQFTGTSAPVGSEEYTVPISSANEEGQSVLIHITNPSDSPITVTLTFQGKDKEITVPPGDVHSEFIARPANFPSGLPTETARLKSDSPFVASVTMVGSCSSYLAIPNEGLGKRYQVITWDPASSPMGNAWFTISTVRSTIVKIAIPEGTCVVKSSYINPLCGDEFQVYLPDYAAITFTSIDDLSGTTIESQEPVLVIAGNDNINIGSTSVSDNSISELFPVEAWGTDFVVPPVPENDGSGYSIKMSCGSSPATATVQSASGKTTHELTEGKSVVVEFTDNSIISISSDSPIQVLQFVQGGQPPSGTGCPSSLNVVSTSLYMSTYYTDVWLSKAAYIDYVTMIIEGSEAENLMMDDEAVDSEDWKDVPGTTMKCKHMKITNQRTKFSHTSEKFGLFRYSYLKATDIDKACALSYVAGADFSYAKSMNESTTPAASNESSTLMPSTTMASAGSTMTMGSTTTAAPSVLQITDCSCLNLTSTIQPGTSGAYYLEGQQYKNKPVYKRKDCELYLYYYEDSSVGYWLVGPEIGDSRAYIANTRIYRPINDTQPGSWTVYDEEADDFVADPGLQIKCSCSLTTSCTSGEFTQNGTSLLEGVFSLADQFYNGNPVYEHESGKLFLYYNRDSTGTCSYWVVSNELGSTAGIIYAYDTSAQSPGDVITWQSKGQATSSDKISFTCYSSSEEDS